MPCPRCQGPLTFVREGYACGWHEVVIRCRRCRGTMIRRSGLPLCPRCGTALIPQHRQSMGDNGIWVDAGYQCGSPWCPEVNDHGKGRRVWTMGQLEQFWRERGQAERLKEERRAEADEKRARRAARLQAQMGER